MRAPTGLTSLAFVLPLLFAACGAPGSSPGGARGPAPELTPAPSPPGDVDPAQSLRPPVEIGPDGFFRLEGRRTVLYGLEEEHHRYTRDELEALIPRLKQLGVNFLVLYRNNPQEDFFYQRLGEEGLWVAQELGGVKKITLSPFANTGGNLGTLPDEALVVSNLAWLVPEVTRLSRFRSILFWWLGGEFAEPEFHTQAGAAAVRDSVARYRDAVRAADPLGRPFTVSHHYVEALEDAALSFIDFSDLTDFTWFTVATHFHSGDFVANGGWWPVARASEVPAVFEPTLQRASALNHRRPVFLAGWFAQAPLWGPCDAGGQGEAMREKWRLLSTVPNLGASTYHLSEWNQNGMPHALLEWKGGDWKPTAAGETLRGILAAAPR